MKIFWVPRPTGLLQTPTVELYQFMLLQRLGHRGYLVHFGQEAVKNFLPSVLAMLVELVTTSWTTCTSCELLPGLLGLPNHLRNLSFFPVQQSGGQKFTKSVLKIHVREICDSHGIPTVEVGLHTSKGLFRPAVPSSASIGVYEVQDKTYWERLPQRLLSTWIKLWRPLWLVRNWRLWNNILRV